MKQIFQQLSETVAAVLGSPSIYRAGGSEFQVDASIKHDVEFYDDYGNIADRATVAIIPSKQLESRPAIGDTIKHEDRTWHVERTLKDDGYRFHLVVS